MKPIYTSTSTKKRRYRIGGEMDDSESGNGFSSAVTGIGPLAMGFIDAVDSGNAYGRQSLGSTTAKGVLSGAMAGAALGVPGIAIGAALGGISSFFGGKSAKKKEQETIAQQTILQGQQERNRMAAQLAANPSLYEGYRDAQYYAKGGMLPTQLAMQPTQGGSLVQQSSDGTEAKGNSHLLGGINISSMNAEVEGGETTKDNYVFSKELGFADLHKPIMKAKGKIEKKPFTPERANSIKLLNARENKLMLSQEYLKHQLGLQ